MEPNNLDLIESVKEIIISARLRVYRMANSSLLETYWQIGKLIVEDEQMGKAKAQYGKATIKRLSQALTLEFGKGYDESNLRNIRSFYIAFPIRDALRHELSWTHYRLLSRLDSGEKRAYYLNESLTSNWNSRQLQRQINTLAFERVVKHLPEKEKKSSIEN
jgi:predicted nuclease of restriction endonuclease-like (RecB) superfamily